MKNPLEHLRQYPKTCKQLIGLTLSQLEELIQQAIALDKKQKKEQEMAKVRVNQKGAGRWRSLSPEEGICLTLFYLRKRQKHTFKNQVISLPKGNDITVINQSFW